jgi:hypothetical protein
MRHAILAAATLAACHPILNETTRPTNDTHCRAALEYAHRCDARFPDRSVLCEYSSWGECAPYINPAQSQCLRESSCDAVRSALDRKDWLCGVPLSAGTDP